MKAITIIAAAVLTLPVNVLFAGNDGASLSSGTVSFHISLAPIAPSEATFEEMNDAAPIAFIFGPVTPVEADFSDAVSENMTDFSALAPVTPGEADFISEDLTFNASAFAPVTPSAADFSDGI